MYQLSIPTTARIEQVVRKQKANHRRQLPSSQQNTKSDTVVHKCATNANNKGTYLKVVVTLE